jgi:predicted DNA-binding antitoxin AbrB/MazE fold protein
MAIRAVYEKGVFRPTEKVDFPDPCEVEIDVRQEHNLAERHNEHQP